MNSNIALPISDQPLGKWKRLGPPQRKDTMEIEGVKLKQNRKVDNQREVEDNGITLWGKKSKD